MPQPQERALCLRRASREEIKYYTIRERFHSGKEVGVQDIKKCKGSPGEGGFISKGDGSEELAVLADEEVCSLSV